MWIISLIVGFLILISLLFGMRNYGGATSNFSCDSSDSKVGKIIGVLVLVGLSPLLLTPAVWIIVIILIGWLIKKIVDNAPT